MPPFQADEELKIYHAIQELGGEDLKNVAEQVVEELVNGRQSTILAKAAAPVGYNQEPVTMKTFLEDPYYMGGLENLRSVIKDDLIALFDEGEYVEGAVDGAIGFGKSTFVSLSASYMVYRLSCIGDPQAYYGLLPGTTIYLVNQSINKTLAKKVVFGEIKARIALCPYFKEQFTPDPHILSELIFPKNIQVLPVASDDTSAIGLNIFGGFIDEINFMRTVKRSTRAHSVNELYDTPSRLYEAIVRRIKSRFLQRGGYIPGKIIAISASQYPDDFTQKKKIEAATDKRIFIRSHSLWEGRDQQFSGETFRVEVGGEMGSTRILTGDELPAEIQGEIIEVPTEFRPDFDKDLHASIRDIAGRPTSAVNPFITDVTALEACIDPARKHPYSSMQTTLQDGARIMVERLAELDKKTSIYRPIAFPEAQRYCHIDYALTSDECGLAIGCTGAMVPVVRRDESGVLLDEQVPFIHIDLMLRIVAPPRGEIDLRAVRAIVYAFQKYGFSFGGVTFDSFQSAEGIQELTKKGINSYVLSVDTDLGPYNDLKSAISDRRLGVYEYPVFMAEAKALELDRERAKVDHPPAGDKGITDAVAGVVHQCVEASLTVPKVRAESW